MSNEDNNKSGAEAPKSRLENIQTSNHALKYLRYTAATDIGMRREENQDSYGVIENNSFRFFIVADGMGGVQGGATASKMAVNIVEQYLKDKKELTSEDICAAISVANKLIFEKGASDANLSGMGTTFVGIAFVSNRMFVVNVGDSRAYCIRKDTVKRLTEDHTLVMELVRSGTISVEQASNHPVSHMLTRSLGPTPEIEIDCQMSGDCPMGEDYYLLCSDGLYNMVAESEMLEIISQNSIDQATEMLIELANQRGGTDNITLILVKTDGDFPVDQEVAEAAKLESNEEENITPKVEEVLESEVPKKEDIIENFDPFSVPELDAHQKKIKEEKEKLNAEAEAKLKSKKTEKITKPKDEAAKEVKPEDKGSESKDGENALKEDESLPAQSALEEEEGARRSTQSIIITGVMAGIIGGTVVVLLSRMLFLSPAPEKEAKIVEELKDEPVYNIPVPKIPNMVKNDSVIVSMKQEPKSEDPAAVVPDIAATISAGNDNAMANLEKRREKLLVSIQDTKLNLERFKNPSVINVESDVSEEQKKHSSLSDNLRQVRNEIDTATRKLAIWYGRKTRVKESDLTNLASEVAVSSEEVRRKKEEFELASWNYLKESEALRYMPSDVDQRKKVDQLIEVRNSKIKEMSQAVSHAIEKEIKDVEQGITDFTIQKEKLQDQLDYADKNIQYLKILQSGSEEEKLKKRNELENMLVSLESELGELQNLLPKKGAGEAEISASEVKEKATVVN